MDMLRVLIALIELDMDVIPVLQVCIVACEALSTPPHKDTDTDTDIGICFEA